MPDVALWRQYAAVNNNFVFSEFENLSDTLHSLKNFHNCLSPKSMQEIKFNILQQTSEAISCLKFNFALTTHGFTRKAFCYF